LEYKAKANALSKPRKSCLSTTIDLHAVWTQAQKPRPWRFTTKFKRNLLLSIRNASKNMEAKQSNKFQSHNGFSSASFCWSLSLRRNHKTTILDHTFYIWISSIVMFP
jgi:hypothetical protein